MKPNFLIIGAARAGTTALFTYIDQHPEVFLHPRKELLFFAYDGAPNFQGPGDAQLNTKWLTTWEDYCSCFSEAGRRSEKRLRFIYAARAPRNASGITFPTPS